MNVISANHVARTCSTNVDCITIAKFFHRVMDLVVLDHIVVCVKEGTDIIQLWSLRQPNDLMLPDCSAKFPTPFCEEVRHAARENDSGVGSVMH